MSAPVMGMPLSMDEGAEDEGQLETLRDLFGPEAFAGEGTEPSKANQVAAPNPPEDDDSVEPLDQYRSLMAALYGSDFPLIRAFDILTAEDPQYAETGTMPPLEALLPYTSPDEWAAWVRGRWALHRAAVEMHLYLVTRNRLFRASQQWVSSSGIRGPWREPARPTESARVVHNLIAPALDQRMQVITDQRPGFQVEPSSLSPDEKRKAEGRQQALEYQYDGQRMDRHTGDACYWAGTDGVAFWHTYWDRDAGPWDVRMSMPSGDGWELTEDKSAWIRAETQEQRPAKKKPLGDLRTKTLRVEQVRVSANATATESPYYAVIREVLSETEASYLYGVSGVQERSTTGDLAGNGDNDTSGTGADGIMPSWVLTQTVVGEGNRLNNIKTVERFTLYADKHPDILPEGLQIVVLGNAVVWGPGELLFGVIPLVPVRDGSTDPSYYPRPIMEQWIAPQMRINAALSLWVNNVRVNSGGRFLAKPDAISRETYIGSGSSIMEVECAGPLGDTIQPVNGFSVGQDTKDLIAFDVKAFEDMSGYNDVSRGQVSGETATAVATANEQLQRIFAPPVGAAATAFEDWATVNIAGMAWGYDIPRDVGAVGTDRPDLARALSAADFDGPCTIKVDGEKLLPMPKIYRMAVLDDWYNRGLITAQQYMRNAKFAQFRQLSSPDEDQEARAKRVADALRLGNPLPPPGDPTQPLALRWQTNESIEQDVLEREVLLQDDLPPQVIAAADARWKALAMQAAQKSGAMAPPDPNAGPTDPQTDPQTTPQTEPPPGGSPVSGLESPAPGDPPTQPETPSPASPEALTMSQSAPVPPPFQ